ncbi:CopG family transcriptional regulator [Glycomyces sp. NPDC048151]|uniref:ribbon-helix-helix domain-containing protein n=1 Tax=Glycomyces sp. NPDC048151 TaxID=3364002 RepID=UPI0037167C20
MFKTTVYLTPEEKDGIRRSAAERGISEAEVIREFIDAGLESTTPQWDQLPVISSPELAALGDEEDYLCSNLRHELPAQSRQRRRSAP